MGERALAGTAGATEDPSGEVPGGGFPLDEDLLEEVEAGADWRLRVWEPERVAVVLGRSNLASREAREAACAADGVPVLRRRGGGGAVVLGPGCLVVSLAKRVERDLDAGGYLAQVVGILAESLGGLTGIALTPRGTGDLCLGERKILGSSLFRRRKILFYQGSLLFSLDLSLVDRYLAHPSREPAYRRGRPHREFLTNLAEACGGVSCGGLSEGLSRALTARVGEIV